MIYWSLENTDCEKWIDEAGSIETGECRCAVGGLSSSGQSKCVCKRVNKIKLLCA